MHGLDPVQIQCQFAGTGEYLAKRQDNNRLGLLKRKWCKCTGLQITPTMSAKTVSDLF